MLTESCLLELLSAHTLSNFALCFCFFSTRKSGVPQRRNGLANGLFCVAKNCLLKMCNANK